jgi:hypothetical protein
MARQEDTCRRCGADWDSKDKPRLALRVIPGGAQTPPEAARQPRTPTPVADDACAATEAQLEADRWIDEGGSIGADATALPSAAAARR